MSKNAKAYLVGGGIASLSAAVYLIQEAGIKGEDITIFDAAPKMGGSLDAQFIKEQGGYVMRGVRMFEEKSFNCTFDLMSRIPSLNTPGKNLREVFLDYNQKNKTYSKSRLIKDGQAMEQHHLRLRFQDRLALVRILFKSEKSCENKTIQDYFENSFFQSNFWYEFCTVFAFEPWHSLIEFRRYLLRFFQDFPVIDTLEGIEVTSYNQYEALVKPVVVWLEKEGLKFESNTKVLDIDFKDGKGKKYPSRLYLEKLGEKEKIEIRERDYLLVTLGSLVANSSIGSMKAAPKFDANKKSPAWLLWENIAKKEERFGQPEMFASHIDKSKWISFTALFKDEVFYKLTEKFIDRQVANFGGVNIISSNWLISIAMNYQPYFESQPKGSYLCWGYGLFSEREGNYVKKKMTECSGEEIMTEIIYHLGFEKDLDKILANTVCIPCLTPYVTSQFLPRAVSDRPKTIPLGYKHLAFLGQYTEIPHDTVFTVDYSVRSAQTAVYSLFNVKKKVTPIYEGFRHFKVVLSALKTLFR